MGSIYLPYQKPTRWNIDPNAVAYNCARMGLPVPPVLNMPFWERGNKAFDYSGNQNTGTFFGNSVWGRSAIYFPGNTDYVRVNDNPSIKNFSALTLEALIYPTADPGADSARILHKAQGATGDDYALSQVGAVTDRRHPAFRINTNLGVETITGNTELTNNSKWYHVACTWDGDAMKLYVDGKLDGSGNQDGVLDDSNEYLAIGRHVASNTRNFNGYIAYVRIFPVALTQRQVQVLRDNPYGMYEPTRRTTWKVPSVGGVAPTSIFYGPLTGPLGGPI